MKRSEIHMLITNKLNKTYGIVDGHWFFADSLLKDLEQAGMLPPESNSKTYMNIMTDNQWDPEDE